MVGEATVPERGAAAVARTVDRGAVDQNCDKHALTSAASQLWPRHCWYTASTTRICTMRACETPTQITVVGDATCHEVGATAVAVPVAAFILKFVKHGLASAATATLAKHPAPITVTATPRARPP